MLTININTENAYKELVLLLIIHFSQTCLTFANINFMISTFSVYLLMNQICYVLLMSFYRIMQFMKGVLSSYTLCQIHVYCILTWFWGLNNNCFWIASKFFHLINKWNNVWNLIFIWSLMKLLIENLIKLFDKMFE
jgi:hypothetical protein